MPFRRSRNSSLMPNVDMAYKVLQPESYDPSRRKVLKMFAGVALGYLVADKLVGQWTAETYRSNGTGLRLVGGQNLKSNLLVVSFGGEGNYEDYWGALSNYKAANKQLPTADMVYDNIHGLNFQDMARVLQDAQRKREFQYLVVSGDSLGAMFGMYAALLADIPVAGFIANSGPMKLRDAKSGAVLAADLVTSGVNPKDKLVLTSELALKDLWCYFRDNSFDTAMANLPNELWTLPDQMAKGGSAELQRSELWWAQPQQINFETLAPVYKRREIIGDFTHPIFLKAWDDNVINPDVAHRDWEHWFQGNFGLHMPLEQMRPGSGHADVFAGAAILQKCGYFTDLIDQFDPPSISNPTLL